MSRECRARARLATGAAPLRQAQNRSADRGDDALARHDAVLDPSRCRVSGVRAGDSNCSGVALESASFELECVMRRAVLLYVRATRTIRRFEKSFDQK